MSRLSLRGCRLYVIVDGQAVGGRDPVEVAVSALRGGADAVQWRDKAASDKLFYETALRLREATRPFGKPFIVNDRVAVALAVGADGVHLGHEDLPIDAARGIVGDRLLIGRSTHSLEEACAAEAAGADYLGVGPVFPTPTKPDYPQVGLELIAQAAARIRIPWVAIGGIDLENLPLILSAGATRVAVVRAIAAVSHPEAAARSFQERMSS